MKQPNKTHRGGQCRTLQVEDQKTKISRHMKVEHEKAGQRVHDRKEEVKTHLKFDTHRVKFIGLMTEFEPGGMII